LCASRPSLLYIAIASPAARIVPDTIGLKVLRGVEAGAFPGKSLGVSAPALGLVADVFPCEDGHAQERALVADVLKTVEAGDLWREERNFCPRAFLCQSASREAFFVTRAHPGFPCEIVTPLRIWGRPPTGEVAPQRVRVRDAEGNWHACRRLRITRKHATQDGAKRLDMLTHFPPQVAANRVCVHGGRSSCETPESSFTSESVLPIRPTA
jgi:hypothetical protein